VVRGSGAGGSDGAPAPGGSAPRRRGGFLGVVATSLGRLVALGRLSVTSDLPVARKQAANLLQCLLVAMSRVPDRRWLHNHQDHLLYAGRT
jgi:hypothetical protein